MVQKAKKWLIGIIVQDGRFLQQKVTINSLVRFDMLSQWFSTFILAVGTLSHFAKTTFWAKPIIRPSLKLYLKLFFVTTKLFEQSENWLTQYFWTPPHKNQKMSIESSMYSDWVAVYHKIFHFMILNSMLFNILFTLNDYQDKTYNIT